MDEIRRLEQEINSLQAQLRQQNSEEARARQRMIDDNKRALDNYQRDMRRALSEHDRDTQAEYERLLTRYQRSLSEDVQLELAQMDANYSRLVQDVQRSEAALLAKNQELEQAIQAIRSDVSRRNEGSSQEAKQYILDATASFKGVEQKPHEKFMPKRLVVFYNAIKDGQDLFRAGLYEAAIAVAISAKAGIERLGFNIDDKVDEWDKQYELFMYKLSYLQGKIQQELTDWQKYIGETSNKPEERKTRLTEINYWSKGVFAEVFKEYKQLELIAKDIATKGKAAYLKQPDGLDTDQLKECIASIDKLEAIWRTMIDLYKNRYSASCERAMWGESIIDFLMDEINLLWHEELTGFRDASEEDKVKTDFTEYVKMQFGDELVTEDTREWLRIVFENSSENYIYIYILPVEAHSMVNNKIVLHIDYHGAEQEAYSKDIYQHICEAIEFTDDNTGLVNYASDINALKFSNEKLLSETAKDIERQLLAKR